MQGNAILTNSKLMHTVKQHRNWGVEQKNSDAGLSFELQRRSLRSLTNVQCQGASPIKDFSVCSKHETGHHM